ncbi:nuclear transport factor 2 family protein [Primorskyibacter sp. S187A]|uniref:nuclear transport factor 2 family protein n=1 Tax=Primorskyibacter sp. S187A TaxID=3415130 RepID=UPI003C79FCFB
MLHAVWVEQDYAKMARYFSPDAAIHGVIPGMQMTLADYAEAAAQVARLAQVHRIDIRDFAGQAPGPLAARVMLDMTALATKASAPMEAAVFCKIEDELIVEYHVVLDLMTFLEQSGLVAEDARMLFLTGSPLA